MCSQNLAIEPCPFRCLVFQDRRFVMCREVFPQSASHAWMLQVGTLRLLYEIREVELQGEAGL